MTTSAPLLILAAVASLTTFVCIRGVIHRRFASVPSGLLAAAVAGLAFLGLTTQLPDPIGSILVGYAALAICLTVFAVLRGLPKLLQGPRTDCASARRARPDAAARSQTPDGSAARQPASPPSPQFTPDADARSQGSRGIRRRHTGAPSSAQY